MSLENTYYIGQTMAVIAILGSLVALLFQMRSNNRESRALAMHQLSVEYRNMMEPMHSNPVIAPIWLNSLSRGYRRLEPNEAVVLGAYVQSLLRSFEEMYFQHQSGRLDARLWKGVSRNLAEIFSTKGLKEYWSYRSHIFSDEFVAYVEELAPIPYHGAGSKFFEAESDPKEAGPIADDN